jgi:tyrosine-protein phosphatase YwqE
MGIFGSIFGSENKKSPVDLSLLGTDLHSHFIPGIDDGAQDMESALHLVRAMHELGYKKLITTPHVMSDYYKNTPEIILSGLKKLQDTVSKAGIPITIEAAAEYYIDDYFTPRIDKKELLTFAGNHVLVELPFFNEPQQFLKAVFDLTVAGYKVVLAHVERYTYWYHDFENYEKLKDREVLFQMNITSLFNDSNSHLRKICEKLIDADMINVLGSDAHNMQHIDKIKNVLHNKHLHKLIESGKLINEKL